MKKYFMQDTPLAWVEKFMMQPPNYHRKIGTYEGGSVYACTRCVRREDRRLLCAGASECICFNERLEYGFWSFHDLLDHYVNTTATERAKNKIRKLFAKQKNIFLDEAHQKRMDELAAAGIMDNHQYTAAAFLVSANHALHNRTRPAFGRQAVYFNKADIRGIDADGYTLYKAAKHIYLGGTHLKPDELFDEKIIDDKLFRLIISAFVIQSYGLPPQDKKEGSRKWTYSLQAGQNIR